MDRAALINQVEQGIKNEYLFFWGHQKSKKNITKACFSQWYEASFVVNGQTYLTAEHYMMAKKAELFLDYGSASRVLSAQTPKEAKAIGREVVGFNETVWQKHRFQIVLEANFAKFSQNDELLEFLLGTEDMILVEASPVDPVWGIGLAADDPNATYPSKWKGLNLLGFALMQVRQELVKSS